MKKILVMVVTAMMVAVSANAQNEWKNEISVSYGGGNNTNIMSTLVKGVFTGKQTSYWGPVGLEYFYRPQSKLGIGAVATVGGCEWDDEANAKSTYISIMPAIKYNWLVKEHFSMYSKVAIGLTVVMDSGDIKKDESSVGFNWQASPIGMEFGGALCGFAEFGFGEQGIVLGGIRYKF